MSPFDASDDMGPCITPGMNKLYRLALVGPGDSFEALSEHDTPEHAMAAKLLARAAQARADLMLNKVFKECVR